jgi:hypothetical protein
MLATTAFCGALCIPRRCEYVVKVRIKVTPSEREMDGVTLGNMAPGSVREVSSSIGSWLIAQGYAEPEMRSLRDSDQSEWAEIGVPVDRRSHS